MRQASGESEKRTCSKIAPFIYFALESMAILLVIYIVTGGDIVSKLGLILAIFGLLYPALKLPKFIRRVVQCRTYRAMQKA